MPTTFTTNPISLKSLLDGLKDSSIQLPDFQRGWVWDDERIRAVLASVSRAFPIGAVMMLQTGGETHFKTRPVQGVADLWRDNLDETRATIWMRHDSRDARMIVAARQERKSFMLGLP